MKLFLIALLLTSSSAVGQLPEAPEARPAHIKRLVASNVTMYAATVFDGFGLRGEVDTCVSRMGLQNGVYATGAYAGMRPSTQKRFYAIAMPIDAAVTTFSLFAHRRHWHGLEITAPFAAAAAHVTLGAMRSPNGCY